MSDESGQDLIDLYETLDAKGHVQRAKAAVATASAIMRNLGDLATPTERGFQEAATGANALSGIAIAHAGIAKAMVAIEEAQDAGD